MGYRHIIGPTTAGVEVAMLHQVFVLPDVGSIQLTTCWGVRVGGARVSGWEVREGPQAHGSLGSLRSSRGRQEGSFTSLCRRSFWDPLKC